MACLNRRGFVGTAAALSVPTLITSAIRAQDGKPAPSARLRLGFIGTGKMNGGHLGYFLGQPDVLVVAVCDVDTRRRNDAKNRVDKKYAEEVKSGKAKGCAAYVDFRELIARPDIDAVVIATPDHWHTIPAIEALKAGKDVYCEKPLTLTLREAKLLIDATRKYDRVFQVGSQQRSSAEFRVACELVRNGRIGKLQTVYANVGGPSVPCDLAEEPMEAGLDWERWVGPAPMRPYNSVLSPRGVHNHYPNWRSYREYSGGGMTDFGAHHFDIAQWGLGMDMSGPVEIIPPTDPKVGRGAKFVYASGAPLIHAPEYAPGKKFNSVAFIGNEGTILVDRGFLASTPEGIIKTPESELNRADRCHARDGCSPSTGPARGQHAHPSNRALPHARQSAQARGMEPPKIWPQPPLYSGAAPSTKETMKMRRMGDKPGIKTIAARVKKPKKAVNIMYQCEYPQSPAERNNLLPLANWP